MFLNAGELLGREVAEDFVQLAAMISRHGERLEQFVVYCCVEFVVAMHGLAGERASVRSLL